MLFYLARARPLDADVQASPGALANFYASGTNNPQDTWQDAALTILHENPVRADDFGLLPPIYLDPTLSYKCIITAADGTSLPDGTIDPVIQIPLSQTDFNDYQSDSDTYKRTSAEIAATITPTNFAVPSHDTLGYVLANRYGFSATATGAANYAALVKAHTVAAQAGCALMTPDGSYSYTPTAAINLAVDWCSEGQTTLLVNMTGYSGIVFQQFQSTVVRNIQGSRTGTLQGTFLKQSALVTSAFTGQQILDRVWAFGFGRNLDIGNVFHNTYMHCRFYNGTTGIYCVPDGSTGNGAVNLLKFIGCEIFGNAQNMLFTSTLQSRGVEFYGCSSEQPTTTGATFSKIRGLHFYGGYFEGSNTIKALILNDCSVGSSGQLYLNGTAGITLGTNTEANFKGIRNGSITDVLTGGDGTQTVMLEDCQLPASGSSLTFAHFVAINSNVNGVFYGLLTNNNDTAFTPTALGTSVAGTPVYSIQNGYAARVGSQVVVRGTVAITAKTGMTGNLQIGGLPFTSSNQANGHTIVPITCNGLTNSASYTQFVGRIQPNSSVIDIIELGSNQSSSLVPITNVSATAIIQFTATYSPT